MSLPRIHLSERSQVALTLFLAAAALFATWYFLLLPQSRQKAEIEALQKGLAASPYAKLSIPGLVATAEARTAQVARLEREWAETVERLATFANQTGTNKFRIDYKSELFITRQNLVQKYDALKIPLIPTDLGIEDVLSSRDPVQIRDRWRQLKAVERLADLALDRHIERLIAIHPLPPVPRKSEDNRLLFTEYPVWAEFDIDFDNLYALFQSVFEENHVFAFRNIRIESGTRRDAPVRVNAVMSALVFE